MKPVCVPCERFMRPKRNGYYFIEGMPTDQKSGVGKDATGWVPYKIWCGDLWYCPTCEAEIVVGVGREPITVQHKDDFKSWLDQTKGVFVKDC